VRKLLIVAIAAGVALLPASTAWARGDGWEPLPFNPYDASCGSTTVHVAAPVNKEYGRSTTLPDGTIREQVTGSLKINYSTDAGASITVNASGPGVLFLFPNGDVEIQGKGLNSYTFSAEQAEALGVPQISVSAGPIDITYHADGTASGHLGNIIRDICAEIGA
jgi:hypothetical protein